MDNYRFDSTMKITQSLQSHHQSSSHSVSFKTRLNRLHVHNKFTPLNEKWKVKIDRVTSILCSKRRISNASKCLVSFESSRKKRFKSPPDLEWKEICARSERFYFSNRLEKMTKTRCELDISLLNMQHTQSHLF